MEEDAETEAVQEVKRYVYAGFDRKVFPAAPACPGCGELLALKIALQVIENPLLVSNLECAKPLEKIIPMLSFPDVASSASIASKIIKADETIKKKPVVLCYSNDNDAFENIQPLLTSAKAGDDVLYICYNKQVFGRSISRIVMSNASYNATASLSHYEDFIKKIQKSLGKPGFRFIEVLAPCPAEWRYEPANTILISSHAVETAYWPLYEIENKRLTLTVIPSKIEPVKSYLDMQKKIKMSEEQSAKLQEKINEEWKMLKEGKTFLR